MLLVAVWDSHYTLSLGLQTHSGLYFRGSVCVCEGHLIKRKMAVGIIEYPTSGVHIIITIIIVIIIIIIIQ